MSRAVLFCNGEIRDFDFHRQLLKDDDFIIAVDGGGCFCRELGVKPQLVLGDFDSLPPEVKTCFKEDGAEILGFPADKDFTDLVLAVEEARKRGFGEILILGALGGKRADMHIGNVLALSAYDEKILIKNENSEIRFLRKDVPLTLRGRAGDYVSLLPLSDTVKTGVSRNLKYPLEGLVFQRGETRSISNELIADRGELILTEGEAVVILQKG